MTTGTGPVADAFAAEMPPLNLPTDHDRTAGRTPRLGLEPGRLDRTLVVRLKEVSSNQDASLGVLLFAGFVTLLHRLTGQGDLVVGVAAGAPGGLTWLPVRCQVHGSQSFRELLAAVAAAADDGQNAATEPHALASDLWTSSVQFHIGDLSLRVSGVGGELRVECEYNSDLFDATTIRRWLDVYRRLLIGGTANVDSELDALPWVSRDDLQSIHEWNSTATDFPNVCIQHLVEQQARRTPDAVAAQFEARAITYDALNRRANQLARRLRDLGVAKDHLVGLCVDRSIEMLVGLLGILKAGGAYVPLDPAYPVDRLTFMMTDSGMRVLVTERALQTLLTTPPDVKTVCLDDSGIGGLDEGDLPRDVASPTPDSIAYVIYTSGSTGRPKGVLVPHRAVVNLLSSVRERPGLSAHDVVLAITTLSFDIAVSELLLPLSVGARIVIATHDVASDGTQLLQLVRDAGVTFIDATPSTWRLLIDAGWNGGEGVAAVCTGEAMPRDLARELVQRAGRVWNGYGPTETTVWSTFYEVKSPVERVLIGTPVANTRIYILDERMQPVAVGVPGEIYIAGAGVTCGYLNRPDLTRERFLPDPFDDSRSTMYRTGDVGRYLQSGQIECLGRTDDQVKIRGFRIELGEIEDALSKHDAIARVAVIAREDRPGDRRLVGYVVLRDGRAATDAALRVHVCRWLPDYMAPAAFVRLSALPLTPSGKVNRRDLPAPTAARDEHDSCVSPRTPTEAMLVELWKQALGLERVSVEDDFFSLGGHSLRASHVLARLRRDHGIGILFRTLFEAPTIEQLAVLIDAQPRSTDQGHRTIARRLEDGASRLSVAQERMWLLEMMDPQQRVVHNLPCAWRLSGELDEAILEQSVNAIIARHETLRTRITVRAGTPFQEVAPVVATPLGRLDLREFPEAQRDAAMLAFCDRETKTPFDLSVAPLFRATLIRLDELEHVLFVLPHNLIWDGWSFDIFLGELGAFYTSFIEGRPAALAELPISYRDFALWKRDWLGGDESAQQGAWWRTQLDGNLPVLELPSDRPRPVESTRAVSHVETRFSREQVDALAAISGKSGGTLFTILFAAFCVLLHRLSGQDDLLVGTPARARTRPETEPLIGLFMNMLVLRSHMDEAQTFVELLARVRTMTLDALSHQDLPLEALDVRAPILRAFFTMEDGRQRPQMLGPLHVRAVSVMPEAVAADLRFSVTETREGVSIVSTCSSELFDDATAVRLLKRFEALVGDVTRDPLRKVGELNLIPEDERALLQSFGDPAPSPDAVVCAHTLFEQQAERRPGATALVSGAEIITYDELDHRASSLARRLTARGIGNGSRVGVYLPRSADLVTSLLAVMKAGAIWLPLDPDDPPARVGAILDDSGAGFVLTNESLRGRVPAGSSSVVCLEELADTPVEGKPLSAILAASAIPIDAAACLLYTCDAHRLRAAAVSHRTLSALVAAVIRELELTQEDVALAISPPSLDVSVVELLAPLATGAQLVIGDGDVGHEPERLAEMAGTSAATLVIAPTMLWAGVITTPGPWTQLKAICIGGMPAPETSAELVARTAGAWATHGFPAAGIWTTLRRLSDSEPAGLLGRPFGPARVRILDDDLHEAPLGVAGQLYVCVGVPVVPDAGASKPAGEPLVRSIHGLDGAWHRTGECARWKSDGALELVKVRDREVHVNGFRVDLDDVSSVLRSHPAVRDAAVVLQTQGADNARLVAHVVPREGVASTATELRDEARRVLPAGIVLRSFIEVEKIPRTADGQLALEPQGSAGATSGDEYAPPQTATEIMLAELWQDALALPRVGAHDNFFDLGGYSLLCFQVLERIERATGHRVSPRLLLLDSLRQVSVRLDEMAATGDAPRSQQGPPPRLGFFRRLKRLLPGVMGLGA